MGKAEIAAMIPPAIREQIAADPWMKRCIHAGRPSGAKCRGRITWEHALIFRGRQVNEPWAIVPCCEYHHLGPGIEKDLNRHVALQRATDADLAKYPRAGWTTMKGYLSGRFGGSYPQPAGRPGGEKML